LAVGFSTIQQKSNYFVRNNVNILYKKIALAFSLLKSGGKFVQNNNTSFSVAGWDICGGGFQVKHFTL